MRTTFSLLRSVFRIRMLRWQRGFAVSAIAAFCSTNPILASSLTIAPHQAAYKLTMTESDSPGGVVDVTGGMTFEWAEACEGWAIEQRYLLQIESAEAPGLEIKASYVTWESKDGLRYRFFVKRSRTGSPVEHIRGEAVLTGSGEPGKVVFTEPRSETIDLPAGTLFPTQQILSLMRSAKKGERFQQHMLFDGGDIVGAQPVTAVLLAQRANRPNSLLTPPLHQELFRPISLAYFREADKTGTVDFEMTMDLQDNGIVPNLTLDYGDFIVAGELQKLTALPKPKCQD